jgi:hypothetical protein
MTSIHRAAFAVVLAASGGASTALHARLITLEDLNLGPLTHKEDWRPATEFQSNGAFFNNAISQFETWSGFALSRETNTTIGGFGAQFSGFAGSGASGSLNYAIGYVDTFGAIPTITLPAGESPLSLQITNTTYAGISMRDGDQFAKKFGGATGNDPDYFKLTISGLAADGSPLGGNVVDFFLADFRSSNNAQDFILNTWATVNLVDLPVGTRKLQFTLSSSDNGTFGMNTPAYFAVDNITTVPEPATAAFLLLSTIGLASRRKRA